MIEILDEAALQRGVEVLAQRDSRLGGIVARLGPPPLWNREEGFATLVLIVLEQQVSIASARAAFNRLTELLGQVTPSGFLSLDAAQLRSIGFSRQKAGYCRDLAAEIVQGRLDLEVLKGLEDREVKRRLTRLRGIGPWSADIYLLMALGRRDAWPSADLALAVAAQDALRLPQRPGHEELEALAETWRPYRAVAARVLWMHYLNGAS